MLSTLKEFGLTHITLKDQGAYSWYSYMDTDSKYTFNHMSREFSEDPRPKRVSWVPASFLPTSSRSSVSYGSSPDWTSHRGTSTVRDLEKTPKIPQKSYFSPLTSASLSTIAFQEPPPVPKKPMEVDTLTISTSIPESPKKVQDS